MPTTWSLGTHGQSLLPDFLERGVANTVTTRWSRDGAAVTPDTATCTVYNAAGSAVSTGTASVSGSGDGVGYTFTPSTSEPYGEGWRVVWELALGSATITIENEAMLVRRRIQCPVDMSIVWLHAPSLNPAGASPVTTLTEAEQAYMLSAAWIRVQHRLLEAGRRPFLVIGASALFEVTLQTTLHLLFVSLAHRLNESYASMAESYRLQAEEAWKRVVLAYDETQTGRVQERTAAKPSGWWIGPGRR